MIRSCARAPVRVDPAGGGTDAPPFCDDHGGAVVNFATQIHAFASVERLSPDAGVRIVAEDLGVSVAAESSSALRGEKLEFLEAFVRRLVPDGDSILLVTESDCPAGAGLGGSGALGVAVVAALDHAYDRSRSPLETAALANEIERVDLGYAGGSQDSYGAALGGINLLEYPKGGGFRARSLDISASTRHRLEHRSLLIYTSEAHVSSNIHEDIKASYYRENSPTVAAMIQLREAAERMAVGLEAGDFEVYTEALNVSSRGLYSLHPSCQSEAHHRIFSELEDDILAGKTCGAGGGGFLVLYTKSGRRRSCMQRALELGARVWPVRIDEAGVIAWSEEAVSDPTRHGCR